MKIARSPMTFGAVALAVMAASALTAALLYVSPPGQKTIAFYTTDAASIRPGVQIRVAGIPVGKVKELSLEADRVRVTARVDQHTFVGDKSQVEVRMLTVVGGYYVNLIPVGDIPLGDEVIPFDRVTMPYNLVRTLNDSSDFLEELDPKPFKDSLDEIETGLSGDNTATLTAVIDAGNSIMSTVQKQRGQITAILNLSDEYLAKLTEMRQDLTQIVQKIAIIQATLEIYAKGFGYAGLTIGKTVAAISPLGVFYENHREQFLEKTRNFLQKGRHWIDRNGVTVRGLRAIQRHLERILDVQQAAPELLATDLCIPMPGSPC